jgi:hypothetical protein
MLSRGVLGAVLAVMLMLPSASTAQHSNSAVHNGLLYAIETDASMYWMYSQVAVSYSVTNVTQDPIHLTLECMKDGGVWDPLLLRIFPPDGPIAWWDPVGCYWMYTDDVLAPGASFLKEITWDMVTVSGGHVNQTGTYTIKGSMYVSEPEYNYTIALGIELLDPASGVSDGLPDSWSTIKALYR